LIAFFSTNTDSAALGGLRASSRSVAPSAPLQPLTHACSRECGIRPVSYQPKTAQARPGRTVTDFANRRRRGATGIFPSGMGCDVQPPVTFCRCFSYSEDEPRSVAATGPPPALSGISAEFACAIYRFFQPICHADSRFFVHGAFPAAGPDETAWSTVRPNHGDPRTENIPDLMRDFLLRPDEEMRAGYWRLAN